MSPALPLRQLVQMIMCLRKSTSLLLFLESCLNAGESGISLKHIGRDCKQPSLFRASLLYLSHLILTQLGNSYTETCSLSYEQVHPIPSHLIFNYPNLLPTHGTLNPVVMQLLRSNLLSLHGRLIGEKAISVHSKSPQQVCVHSQDRQKITSVQPQ